MDPALQARLLRVLEDGKVRRLGDTREVEVEVRIVASTHQDLEAAVREPASNLRPAVTRAASHGRQPRRHPAERAQAA